MMNFGWKKDKFDDRDFLHKVSAIARPNVCILPDVPSVRDQGDVGSCVGFGIGANITGHAMQLKVFSEWFSPTWIYNGARFIDGSLLEDAGAYPRDALDWLVMKGCLLEHFWPYNPTRLDKTSPPSAFNAEAAKWPMVSYYRITGGTGPICDAIAQGHYVSIGTPWYDAWMDPDPSGLLVTVGGQSNASGGHETCLYGYDSDKQIFYGINSWGTEWGNAGHYRMPFQAFSWFGTYGGYDAHYVNVTWSKPSTMAAPGGLKIKGVSEVPYEGTIPDERRIAGDW